MVLLIQYYLILLLAYDVTKQVVITISDKHHNSPVLDI